MARGWASQALAGHAREPATALAEVVPTNHGPAASVLRAVLAIGARLCGIADIESEWVERFGAERVDQLRGLLLELVASEPALSTAA